MSIREDLIETVAQIVNSCLAATEFLSRENRGLSARTIRSALLTVARSQEGFTVDETRLDQLVTAVGQCMRATGLVIEHNGSFFWKSGDSTSLN